MTRAFADLALIGTLALAATRLLKVRATSSQIAPAEEVERRKPTAELPDAPRPSRPAMPVVATAPAMRSTNEPGYILGGGRVGTAADRTTAMMDVMLGPGLCTPHDG